MGSLSIWHWLILGLVVLLLFGKGRFSGMMGDVAKGLKEFKKGMAEDDVPPASTTPGSTTNVPPRIDNAPQQPSAQQTTIEGQPAQPHDPRS